MCSCAHVYHLTCTLGNTDHQLSAMKFGAVVLISIECALIVPSLTQMTFTNVSSNRIDCINYSSVHCLDLCHPERCPTKITTLYIQVRISIPWSTVLIYMYSVPGFVIIHGYCSLLSLSRVLFQLLILCTPQRPSFLLLLQPLMISMLTALYCQTTLWNWNLLTLRLA